jgi:pimeloyl-ACP methyl ester carboxylesterase
MTVERMCDDGIEVAAYLRERIPNARIVLLGHSWGSILGIYMVRKRPDLFAAYVGTAQVTSLPRQLEASYPQLVGRAERLKNESAKAELAAAGVPSQKNPGAYEITKRWAALLEPPDLEPAPAGVRIETPDYVPAGERFSSRVLHDAIAAVDLPALGTKFAIPMYFIQGSDDLVTTTSVVREYFDTLQAPAKSLVVIPNAGHFAIFRARGVFLDVLVAKVLHDMR